VGQDVQSARACAFDTASLVHVLYRDRLIPAIAFTTFNMDASSLVVLDQSEDAEDDQLPLLRSYFDGITKGCNIFRILVIGKAGSGKSTLVSEVFDFELDSAGVQDFCVSTSCDMWEDVLNSS
jgi:hypothetical protein